MAQQAMQDIEALQHNYNIISGVSITNIAWDQNQQEGGGVSLACLLNGLTLGTVLRVVIASIHVTSSEPVSIETKKVPERETYNKHGIRSNME